MSCESPVAGRALDLGGDCTSERTGKASVITSSEIFHPRGMNAELGCRDQDGSHWQR